MLKDVTEFIKKRAVLEAEYAKKLQELCKTVPGSGLFSKTAPIDKESKYVGNLDERNDGGRVEGKLRRGTEE